MRSALKRRTAEGAAAHGAPRATVSFAQTDVTKMIASTRTFPGLWYDGFVVECDRCERMLEWGLEGSVTGAPGRSRFAQGQVICSSCAAERMYAEMGAWFAVALAADSTHAGGVGSVVAQEPISAILGNLMNLGKGRVRQDLLTSLLGPESEDADVRIAVLHKARSHVGRFLGGPTLPVREPVDAALELVGDSESAVEADDASASIDAAAAASSARMGAADAIGPGAPSPGTPPPVEGEAEAERGDADAGEAGVAEGGEHDSSSPVPTGDDGSVNPAASHSGAGSELVLPRVKRRRSEH